MHACFGPADERRQSADVSRNTSHHPCAQAEAVEQCMFRIIDIVDPLNVAAGPILQLEHEV